MSGSVLTQHDDQLVVWDDKAKVLSTVTAQHGSTVEMLTLGNVKQVIASSLDSGELYVVGTDGRITALAPSN